MIVKGQILNALKQINRLYEAAPTSFLSTLYSKMAIIEFCGWIEISMDSIVQHHAKSRLKSASFKKLHKEIVKKNYGFHYNDNFRPMLIRTIGIRSVEKIEIKLNKTAKIDVLSAQLETLKVPRNDASHTYIGVATTYEAPSLTIGRVAVIYPILKEIDAEVRSLSTQ